MDFYTFQNRIGYFFKDEELLKTALTHRSYAYEHVHSGETPVTNERLEFLGDAVLELVSSELLFGLYPTFDEGKLSRLRASLVCENALHDCAQEIGLGDFILLGKGEAAAGGSMRPSIVSDAMEAVIGAIYLDGGFEPAKKYVLTYVLANPDKAENQVVTFDSKSGFQEWAQSLGKKVSYVIVDESGPDHDKCFTTQACVDGVPVAEGKGRSKKQSEQMAAALALKKIQEEQ